MAGLNCGFPQDNLAVTPSEAPGGAAGENRTLETTLEEWSFTTKLQPR